MPIAVVTGSGGLIGSETVRHFVQRGYEVVGVDNNMRAYFFGEDASTRPTTDRLVHELGSSFVVAELDIRDRDGIDALFARHGTSIELVVHCAAQPSHDWAAKEPHTDFEINALGTLNLLEATRTHCSAATFIFCSTNKVYGDRPNDLPFVDRGSRWELPQEHEYFRGIGTSMPIDRSMHSVFGASKVAADVMVQEYGRYFGMPTVCFRGGCLTGPQHAGAQLHGFLAFLLRCTATGDPYTIFGFGGKQVRDNIHAHDVVRAFEAFHRNPAAAAVYNLGGGRGSNVSVLEAITLCEGICGRQLTYTVSDTARRGDHQWYISDLGAFEADFPEWSMTFGIDDILRDMYDYNAERWGCG